MAKPITKSPLAPVAFPALPPVAGVRMAIAQAGIKYRDRADLLLMAFDPGTTVSGVFTKSGCAGAPVEWCRQILGRGEARGVVVNSGNANAFTGEKGRIAACETATYAASALGCAPEAIYLASTGVIGEPLDAGKIGAVLPDMADRLEDDAFAQAAGAIMTTDTFPKGAVVATSVGDRPVKLVGIAKGSGMIAPDMATTLAFVITDAALPAPVLQHLLSHGAADSFNAITVDSDTSTSDTVLLFATGKAAVEGAAIVDAADPRLDAFREALDALLLDLAHQVVRDGEGARKFITVRVSGASSKASARRVAMAIANSPLVKTAIGGEDANWGRIAMAIGKSGEPVIRDRIAIRFGDHLLARDGMRAPHYDEEAVSAYMAADEIVIHVELGVGDACDQVYTCDLTDAYVEINGNYRS